MLNLNQNYFQLFILPQQFVVDNQRLAERFRQLQAMYHPDRFATADDQQRRLSVQTTAFINEAYETLKTPRLRARYLLQLAGVDFNEDTETSKDPAFLMAQMTLREDIEDAPQANDPFAALDTIHATIRQQQTQLADAFKQAYHAKDYETAKAIVLKMRFFERINGEVRQLEEKLEDDLG
jgi:molecular chaperone HscB